MITVIYITIMGFKRRIKYKKNKVSQEKKGTKSRTGKPTGQILLKKIALGRTFVEVYEYVGGWVDEWVSGRVDMCASRYYG